MQVHQLPQLAFTALYRWRLDSCADLQCDFQPSSRTRPTQCNYGDAAFPLDWLFGTFETGASYNKARGVHKLKSEMNGAGAASPKTE